MHNVDFKNPFKNSLFFESVVVFLFPLDSSYFQM